MDASALLEGISERAAGVPPLGNTLKMDFGITKVYVDGTGESNVVSAIDEDADCVISVSPEDFMALVKGDLNPMMAMMTGKVKIKGDMGVAMKLQSLIG
ncbi:MAG: SCP2 sterol-binding domain-containing protein [Bacteroidota bacterium]